MELVVDRKPEEVDVKDVAVYRHGDQFAGFLGKGLADNWSQVRRPF